MRPNIATSACELQGCHHSAPGQAHSEQVSALAVLHKGRRAVALASRNLALGTGPLPLSYER
eukprot:2877720-Alexandrium_andersonii.AAC.1